MDKETKNSIIFAVVSIIIVLAIVLPIVIKRNQENKKLEDSFSTIGQAASDYMVGTKEAESYIDDFSYNYATGEVDYHPTITLEMYNRIKEGMTKEDVISILGNEYEILDGTLLYSLVYEKIDESNGYLIAIHMNKEKDTVFSKNQEGLK